MLHFAERDATLIKIVEPDHVDMLRNSTFAV